MIRPGLQIVEFRHFAVNRFFRQLKIIIFEYTIFNGDKKTYHNSWVTDIPITSKNIVNLVKGGRARWKIENEAFNTLKNQGYHLEHNFGHNENCCKESKKVD